MLQWFKIKVFKSNNSQITARGIQVPNIRSSKSLCLPPLLIVYNRGLTQEFLRSNYQELRYSNNKNIPETFCCLTLYLSWNGEMLQTTILYNHNVTNRKQSPTLMDRDNYFLWRYSVYIKEVPLGRIYNN